MILEKLAFEICIKYLALKFFNSDRNFLEWMNEEILEIYDIYDKLYLSLIVVIFSNGSVEEFLIVISGFKLVNVFIVNVVLNRLRNFINNFNNE